MSWLWALLGCLPSAPDPPAQPCPLAHPPPMPRRRPAPLPGGSSWLALPTSTCPSARRSRRWRPSTAWLAWPGWPPRRGGRGRLRAGRVLRRQKVPAEHAPGQRLPLRLPSMHGHMPAWPFLQPTGGTHGMLPAPTCTPAWPAAPPPAGTAGPSCWTRAPRRRSCTSRRGGTRWWSCCWRGRGRSLCPTTRTCRRAGLLGAAHPLELPSQHGLLPLAGWCLVMGGTTAPASV